MVIVTVFCSKGLCAEFYLRATSVAELQEKGNQYEKQSYLDLEMSGGEGKVYHLEFSKDFSEKQPFLTNVFSGYFTLVTKNPFKPYQLGKSLFNFELSVLSAINSYRKSPLVLFPYGRGISGAVVRESPGFISELIKEANKVSQMQSDFLFVISPNIDMDTFIHESEHIEQRKYEHPIAIYIREIKKILTSEDLAKFDKFAREFNAYIVQRKYLEKEKKEKNGDAYQISESDSDLYNVEKVDFNTYYSSQLEQINISMEMYSDSMNTLWKNLGSKYGQGELCKIKMLTVETLENEFYPLESMLPQLALTACK